MVSLRVSHVVSLCFLSWCLTFHNLCFSCAKTSTLSHLRLQGRQQTRLLQQNEEKCEKQISMASYSCFDSWPYKKPIKGWEWMMRDLVLSLAHSIMSFYGSWALLRWLPSPLLLFGPGVQCPWRDWYLAVKTTWFSTAKLDLMGVSKNRGTPKSSILIGVFHYKPSILGYPYFGNTLLTLMTLTDATIPNDTSMLHLRQINQSEQLRWKSMENQSLQSGTLQQNSYKPWQMETFASLIKGQR